MGVVESSPQAPQMENMTKRNHRNGKTASLSISLRGIERKDSCLSSTLRKISILTIGAFKVASYKVMYYATKNRKFETQPRSLIPCSFVTFFCCWGKMEKRENAKVLFAKKRGEVSPLIFKLKNMNMIFIFLEFLQKQEEHHP